MHSAYLLWNNAPVMEHFQVICFMPLSIFKNFPLHGPRLDKACQIDCHALSDKTNWVKYKNQITVGWNA